MESSIQFNSRWMLKLIIGIVNDLQKFLRYVIGAAIFVFFTDIFVLLTAFAVFYTRGALYLNELELAIIKSALLAETLSLLNFHKLLDISEYILICSIKLYIGIAINMICFIKKHIINFCFTWRKWCIVFKCNICIIVLS